VATEEREVLLLSFETLVNGVLFLREVVYGSDHRVFTRVSWAGDPDEGIYTQGWRQVVGPEGQPAAWSSLDVLQMVARRMAAKGWEVKWSPAHDPALAGLRQEAEWVI
jgi:hypothetical protein